MGAYNWRATALGLLLLTGSKSRCHAVHRQQVSISTGAGAAPLPDEVGRPVPALFVGHLGVALFHVTRLANPAPVLRRRNDRICRQLRLRRVFFLITNRLTRN